MITYKIPFVVDEHKHIGPIVEREKAIETRIKSIWSNAQLNESDAFGFELRVAHKLSEGNHYDQPATTLPRYRRFFLRPAVEPIIKSYEQVYESEGPSIILLQNLSSALTGNQQKIRDKRCFTKLRQDVRREYLDPREVRHALIGHKSGRLETCERPLQRAIYRFLDITTIHPFMDGNGRTCRALLRYDIKQFLQLHSTPLLPLGPYMYYYSSSLMESYEKISQEGNSVLFIETMLNILDKAIDDFRRLSVRSESRLIHAGASVSGNA